MHLCIKSIIKNEINSIISTFFNMRNDKIIMNTFNKTCKFFFVELQSQILQEINKYLTNGKKPINNGLEDLTLFKIQCFAKRPKIRDSSINPPNYVVTEVTLKYMWKHKIF